VDLVLFSVRFACLSSPKALIDCNSVSAFRHRLAPSPACPLYQRQRAVSSWTVTSWFFRPPRGNQWIPSVDLKIHVSSLFSLLAPFLCFNGLRGFQALWLFFPILFPPLLCDFGSYTIYALGPSSHLPESVCSPHIAFLDEGRADIHLPRPFSIPFRQTSVGRRSRRVLAVLLPLDASDARFCGPPFH